MLDNTETDKTNSQTQVIEKTQKPKKVRQAGHFVDRKLEYSMRVDTYLDLFELLSPTTKEKVESYQLSTKTFGIKLTPSEDKLINAIYNLLHYKSENQDVDSDLFYSGNEAGVLVPYGDNKKEARSVFLKIKPSELYQEYVGSSDYSGKEITNIKNILYGLSEKKFLIVYDRVKKVKCGKKTENRTDRIEEFQSLIKIISYYEDMTDNDICRLDSCSTESKSKASNLVIALNPVLTDQIQSKYVLYPSDISKRTMIASGGHKFVTESIIALRDYMLRELSNKRYRCEINADTLPFLLRLDKYVNDGRKKLVTKKIEEAIKVVKTLGIFLEVTIQNGKLGQAKYIFTLNPEFD